MPDRICANESCSNLVGSGGARGFCPQHYRAWRRANAPRCSVADCPKARHGRNGLCANHSLRLKKYGDPEAPLLRQPNDGPCSVEGCVEPMRKRTWCASHYAQWQRLGEVRPFAYKWAKPIPCKVCGQPPGRGFREFCSSACDMLWRAYGGNVPATTTCVGCGCEIDLMARGKGGQRKKAHTSFCRRCKSEYGKYHLTTAQLVERDGTDCGICQQPVDMTLRRSHAGGLMCASVDHILPRSLGGSHEPHNLQLAHLLCNMVKSDRVEGGVEAN